MSYLDLPRLHLLGTFFADPSTVNNDPEHYDTDETKPSPWQNPMGLHRFRFVDVKVNAALDAEGGFVESDPILGAIASSTDLPSAAKLVDLDVYQQGVSTIYGFQLQLAIGDAVLVGTLDTCAVNNLWFQRVLPSRGWEPWDGYGESSFGGDTFASGVYQSVLRIKTWPTTPSQLLSQLQSATTQDAEGNWMLSIRMVLDGFQNVPWHDDVNHGRVLATIGPVADLDEPTMIPSARWLDPRPVNSDPKQGPVDPWYWPNFYSAPCKFVERADGQQHAVLDIANAICLQTPAGTPVPLGDLTLTLGSGASGQALGVFQANQDLYQNLGGILELPVTAAQWAAQGQPLSIVSTLDDIGGPALWTESADGLVIDANDRVFRLPGYAGTTATAQVQITQWGMAEEGFQPAVIVVPVVGGPPGTCILGASVPWSAGYEGDTSQADGALVAAVSAVDENGNCTVTLTVTGDPGSRTEQLDGQLYFVVVYDPSGPTPDLTKAAPRQETLISVVVFSQFNVTPTWETVQALMIPYVKLYPGMTDQIDLSQEQAFYTFSLNPPWIAYDGPNFVPYKLPDGRTISAGAIPYLMTRSVDDTRFMPVSRDLSPDKILHVLNYVADLQAPILPTPPPPPSSGAAPASGGPQ